MTEQEHLILTTLEKRLGSLETNMAHRFDQIDSLLTALTNVVSGLSSRVDNLEQTSTLMTIFIARIPLRDWAGNPIDLPKATGDEKPGDLLKKWREECGILFSSLPDRGDVDLPS